MERICAGCIEFVPKGADHCRCGHDSGAIEVIELHTDEVNYLAYYEARLLQHEERLRDLIARHGRANWTPEQRGEIRNALCEIANSKVTIKQQQQRVAAAHRQLETMMPRIEINRLLKQLEGKKTTPSFGLQADIQRLTTPQPCNPHAAAKEHFR